MRLFRGNTSWLALIGAGFFWAWLDSVVARPTLFGPFGTTEAMNVAYIAVYAASLVTVLAALAAPEKFDRVTAKPHFGPSVGAIASTGCFAIVLGGVVGLPALLWLGVAIVGFELGVLLLVWGRVCVCQGSFHALLHIVGAYACSFFVDLLVVYLQPVPAAVFLSLCPFISGALFWTLATKTADGRELELGSSLAEDEFSMDVAPRNAVSFDAQIILVILGFYAVLGFASFVNNPTTMNASLALLYSLAWEIAGLFLLIACAAFGWRARNISIFGIATFVAAALVALLPVSQQVVHSTSGSLLSAGCVAFDVLCWSLVALSHHFSKRPYIGTVAIVAACQQAGTLIGYTLGDRLPQSSSDPAAYAAIVVTLSVLLIAGTLYLKKSNGMLVAALFSDASGQQGQAAGHESAEEPSDVLAYAEQAFEAREEEGEEDRESAGRKPCEERAPTTVKHGSAEKGHAASAARKDAKRKPAHPSKRRPNAAQSGADDDMPTADKIGLLSDRYGLTRREREVFAQLSMGRSAPYIAEVYQVSENTVRSHIKHIYTKMGVHSRQELLTLVSEG